MKSLKHTAAFSSSACRLVFTEISEFGNFHPSERSRAYISTLQGKDSKTMRIVKVVLISYQPAVDHGDVATVCESSVLRDSPLCGGMKLLFCKSKYRCQTWYYNVVLKITFTKVKQNLKRECVFLWGFPLFLNRSMRDHAQLVCMIQKFLVWHTPYHVCLISARTILDYSMSICLFYVWSLTVYWTNSGYLM